MLFADARGSQVSLVSTQQAHGPGRCSDGCHPTLASTAPTKMQNSPTEANRRILIVDDDEALRMLLVAVLASDAYDVHHASSGVEAVERFEQLRPHLILLGRLMPNLDGFEACA